MITLNLLVLILSAIITVSFCKKRLVKAIVSTFFSFFFCMQVVSLYIGGSFCDYKFFAHFNLRDFWWGAKDIYKFQTVLLVFLFAAITIGIFYFSKLSFLDKPKVINDVINNTYTKSVKFLNRAIRALIVFFSDLMKKPTALIKSIILILSLFFLLITKNGIVDGLKEGYMMLTLPKINNFEDVLKNIEVEISISNTNKPPQKINNIFTQKENLKVSAEGKNIVIISLESFEESLLGMNNYRLTQNINKLRHQWSYFPMHSNSGSQWTVASLYTTFTGLPAYFVGNGNKIFNSTIESKLISITDVLGQSGYEMYHLSDNATFSGTKDLLRAFGIQNILDETLDGKYPDGMKDIDIFNEAKKILKNSNQSKPVMIYISTITTHHPGRPDSRLNDIVEKQKSRLETAIAQTDYLVGDFISFLEHEKLLTNTVFYIFPDHSYMGSIDITESQDGRTLWFLTNANSDDLLIDKSNFYQIDLPRNILSGAKVKHNATFLGDFIKTDKNTFIAKNRNLLRALNSASIIREKTLSNNFNLMIRNNKLVGMIDNDTLFIDPTDSLKKYDRLIFLSPELQIQYLTLFKKDAFDTDYLDYYKDIYIRIGINNKKLNVVWGTDDVFKKTFPATTKFKMNHSSITKTLSAITPPKVKIKQAKEIPKDSVLIDYLQKTLQDTQKTVIISAYDDANTYFSELNPILESVGLKRSLTKRPRWSYIAVFSKDKVYFEKTAQKAIHKKLNIGGASFYISSGGYKNRTNNIIADGKNYGCRCRGLNMVIFNTKTMCIEDVFNVDFYGDKTLTINRKN